MTVYKMIEVVGTSRTSISDAVQGAIHRAAMTVEDIQWFEVQEIRGRVAEDEVFEYQVKVDLGFKIHATNEPHAESRERQESRHGPTARTRSEMAQIGTMGGERKQEGVARGFEKQPKAPKNEENE